MEVADSISEIANSYSPYRLVAFNRIQYLLSALGISIKIFGSCATGLALANSDIDLAVDPSILNYFYTVFGNGKEKVCMALSWIMKLIEGRSWISNLKLITTATVPILKFVKMLLCLRKSIQTSHLRKILKTTILTRRKRKNIRRSSSKST